MRARHVHGRWPNQALRVCCRGRPRGGRATSSGPRLEDASALPRPGPGMRGRAAPRKQPPGDEDAEPREEPTLRYLEEIPAPLDGAAERPLAFGEIPGGRGENVQPLP